MKKLWEHLPVQTSQIVGHKHEPWWGRILRFRYNVVETGDGVEETEGCKDIWILWEKWPNNRSRYCAQTIAVLLEEQYSQTTGENVQCAKDSVHPEEIGLV